MSARMGCLNASWTIHPSLSIATTGSSRPIKIKEGENVPYFETIKQTVKYKKWFFGHYHTDMAVDEKDFCVFEKIMQID